MQNGKHLVTYEDGDTEILGLSNETWRFSTASSDGGTISALCSFELDSSLKRDLNSMFDYFGDDLFLLYKTQGFRSHVL